MRFSGYCSSEWKPNLHALKDFIFIDIFIDLFRSWMNAALWVNKRGKSLRQWEKNNFFLKLLITCHPLSIAEIFLFWKQSDFYLVITMNMTFQQKRNLKTRHVKYLFIRDLQHGKLCIMCTKEWLCKVLKCLLVRCPNYNKTNIYMKTFLWQ